MFKFFFLKQQEMHMLNRIIVSFVLVIGLVGAQATRLNDCKFQTNDGSIIDLSSLNNPTNPFQDQSKDYEYFYNPCGPITCKVPSNNVAICQNNSSTQTAFDLGEQSSSQYNENDGSITYQSSDRTSTIVCECSQEQSFKFDNENPIKNYHFTLKSPCCCKNGCGSANVKKLGDCSALLSNRSIIDLKSLDNARKPLSFMYDQYIYQFNPCSAFPCDGQSKDTAFCQKSVDGKSSYALGDQSSSTFSYNNNLFIQYKSLFRTSNLICVCSEMENFEFITEFPIYNYTFALYSKSCCAKPFDPRPQKLGNCKAKLVDGSIIDLSPLDKPGSPVSVQTDQYIYNYNPCSGIPCDQGAPLSVAVCQTPIGSPSSYVLGLQNVTFDLDQDNTLLMNYTSDSRATSIRCVCNQNIEALIFKNENPIRNYHFELQSKSCCPNGCSSQI